MNIHVITVIIITFGLMYFVFSNISNIFTINYTWSFFVLLSIIFISIIYLFTTVAVDVSTTRHFSFQLLLYLSILSLVYNQNMKLRNVYVCLLLSLIIINASSNSELLQKGNEQPNREQNELKNYLKESNLTLGYGDYWDSNVITYLSREEILIRPVIFTETKIIPFRWFSCERWYTEQPKINESLFVIQKNNQNEAIENFVHKNPPKKTLRFKNYNIYVWNSTELRSIIDFTK